MKSSLLLRFLVVFGFQGVSWIVGADWCEGPPVPIPNTEVKLAIAENTCRATGRENRECRHKKAARRRGLLSFLQKTSGGRKPPLVVF